MASNITLSAGVRQNLLSLQSTAVLMSPTQNRLATGKKVNSALDNPGNFFTSQSLNNRASDLNSLLDSIGQAQQTLKAADTGHHLADQAGRIREVDRQAGPSGPAAPARPPTRRDHGPGEPDGRNVSAPQRRRLRSTVANATTYRSRQRRRHGVRGPCNYTSDAGAPRRNLAGLSRAFRPRTAAGFARPNHARPPAARGDRWTIDAGQCRHRLRGHRRRQLRPHRRRPTTRPACSTGSARRRTLTLTIAVNGGANQAITFGTGAGQVSTLAELNTAIATCPA